jgi:hypothetical protein
VCSKRCLSCNVRSAQWNLEIKNTLLRKEVIPVFN